MASFWPSAGTLPRAPQMTNCWSGDGSCCRRWSRLPSTTAWMTCFGRAPTCEKVRAHNTRLSTLALSPPQLPRAPLLLALTHCVCTCRLPSFPTVEGPAHLPTGGLQIRTAVERRQPEPCPVCCSLQQPRPGFQRREGQPIFHWPGHASLHPPPQPHRDQVAAP